jgi:hypothetical protein
MRTLVAFIALVCLGCLPKIPHQRLSERAKVAVSYVIGPGYSGGAFAPPEACRGVSPGRCPRNTKPTGKLSCGE